MATFKAGDTVYCARLYGLREAFVAVHSVEVQEVCTGGRVRLSAREGAWGFRSLVSPDEVFATPADALMALEAETMRSIENKRHEIRRPEADVEKVREAFRALMAEAPKP